MPNNNQQKEILEKKIRKEAIDIVNSALGIINRAKEKNNKEIEKFNDLSLSFQESIEQWKNDSHSWEEFKKGCKKTLAEWKAVEGDDIWLTELKRLVLEILCEGLENINSLFPSEEEAKQIEEKYENHAEEIKKKTSFEVQKRLHEIAEDLGIDEEEIEDEPTKKVAEFITKEIEILKENNEEREELFKELSEEKANSKSLTGQIKDKDAEIARLKTRNEKNDKSLGEFTESLLKIREQKEKELDEKDSQISNLEDEVLNLEDEVLNLEDEVLNLEDEVEKLLREKEEKELERQNQDANYSTYTEINEQFEKQPEEVFQLIAKLNEDLKSSLVDLEFQVEDSIRFISKEHDSSKQLWKTKYQEDKKKETNQILVYSLGNQLTLLEKMQQDKKKLEQSIINLQKFLLQQLITEKLEQLEQLKNDIKRGINLHLVDKVDKLRTEVINWEQQVNFPIIQEKLDQIIVELKYFQQSKWQVQIEQV